MSTNKITGKLESLKRAVAFGLANGKTNMIVDLDVLDALMAATTLTEGGGVAHQIDPSRHHAAGLACARDSILAEIKISIDAVKSRWHSGLVHTALDELAKTVGANETPTRSIPEDAHVRRARLAKAGRRVAAPGQLLRAGVQGELQHPSTPAVTRSTLRNGETASSRTPLPPPRPPVKVTA